MAREAASCLKTAALPDSAFDVGVKGTSSKREDALSKRLGEGSGTAGPNMFVQTDE